jgi:DNA polymerase-3 subunit alpha (Gram-positive type)
METEKQPERVKTFICFDVETTGLNPRKDRVIEIGAIKVEEGRITGQFSELINPGFPLPPLITNLTGITDDMLKSADTASNVIRRFIDFSEDYIIIGHNVMFDYIFIKSEAAREHVTFNRLGIDTLELSRKLHPDLESRSLENMCRYYHINNLHAHRAYEDAKATALLYVNLSNQFYQDNKKVFQPQALIYKVKKNRPITNKQKIYLIDLLKYHKIDFVQSVDTLTQSEASRWIDKIILEHGRMV